MSNRSRHRDGSRLHMETTKHSLTVPVRTTPAWQIHMKTARNEAATSCHECGGVALSRGYVRGQHRAYCAKHRYILVAAMKVPKW